MAQLFYLPFDPVFTSRGLPAGGAKVYFFYTETTELAPIYANAAFTVRLENPVPADALGGLPAIYLDDAQIYRVRITDLRGAQLGSDYDPYIPGTARKGDPGPPGPANSTYGTLALLKAANPSNKSFILADGTNPPILYGYVAGDFTGQDDEAAIVKLDGTPITTGALVRMLTSGLTSRRTGGFGTYRDTEERESQTPMLGDWLGADDVQLQRAFDDLAGTGLTLRAEPGTPIVLRDQVTLRTGVNFLGNPSGLPQNFRIGTATNRIDIRFGENPADPTLPANAGILMEPSSAIEGFVFNWPDQDNDPVNPDNIGPSSPLDYGYAISTNGVDISDNISIRRLMLRNPRRGINMNLAAQFLIEHIYGQPTNTMLRVQRMFDTSQVRNIHSWPFGYLDPASPWWQLCLANCNVLDVSHADDLMVEGLFGFYNLSLIKMRADDTTNGPGWITASNLCLDVGGMVADIDDCNKLLLSGITATQRDAGYGHPLIRVRSTCTARAMVSVLQMTMDTASIGVKIENGASGTFKLSDIVPQTHAPNPLNDLVQNAIINESTTAFVHVDSLPYNLVSGPTAMGTTRPFTLDSDVTPAGFGTLTNWAVSAGAAVTQITGGFQFNAGANNLKSVAFNIPDALKQEVGVFVAELTIQNTTPATTGASQFYYRIRGAGSSIQDNLAPASGVNGFIGESCRFLMPFIVRPGAEVFEFIFGQPNEIAVPQPTCLFQATGLKVWRVDPMTVDPALVDWVAANSADVANLPPNIAMIAGARVTYQAAAPTAGVHRVGDRVINIAPAVGQPKAWVCTAAPATFVSEGSL